ncbi:MAG TPA: lytic transglycosylase domain-containing protein [Candidatus Limnocylindrales bacterium]|nr:lytic transglycosylase domain-containing protein [Candidatus Limnocylindrales bacterium]
MSPTPTGPPQGRKPCRLEGTKYSESQVKTALEAAAKYKVWRTVQISVPTDLVKSIARHESGWQSNAVSCSGAYGVMQVLPATADWLNTRFVDTLGGKQDYRSLSGNTRLGSAYLQWAIKKISDDHFGGDYTLRPCATSTERCLLNAVISAYEVGEGETSKALASGSGYPNPEYVGNVRWWMQNVY